MTYEPSDEHHHSTDELSAVEEGLVDILVEAKQRPFSVASNFAREYAGEVAQAASMGFITTKIHMNLYGRHWQVTSLGLRWLSELEIGDTQ